MKFRASRELKALWRIDSEEERGAPRTIQSQGLIPEMHVLDPGASSNQVSFTTIRLNFGRLAGYLRLGRLAGRSG